MFQKGHKKIPGSGSYKGQRYKRNVVLEEAFARNLTPKMADELIKSSFIQAKKGDPGLLHVLARYGLTEPPKVVEHQGNEDLPIQLDVRIGT